MDFKSIRLTDVNKENIRSSIKIGFLKEFSSVINHQPHKKILNDMSSGCPACRRSAFVTALKLLQK